MHWLLRHSALFFLMRGQRTFQAVSTQLFPSSPPLMYIVGNQTDYCFQKYFPLYAHYTGNLLINPNDWSESMISFIKPSWTRIFLRSMWQVMSAPTNYNSFTYSPFKGPARIPRQVQKQSPKPAVAEKFASGRHKIFCLRFLICLNLTKLNFFSFHCKSRVSDWTESLRNSEARNKLYFTHCSSLGV